MKTLSAEKIVDGIFKLTQTDGKNSVRTCFVAVDPEDGSVEPVTLREIKVNQKTEAELENEIDHPAVYRTAISEADIKVSYFQELTAIGENVEAANDD
tara:strand:- start:662 stop:955 length:294 start_codon:yes stop_codon:yes gene_type:complete